jgi:hypothetical protein
MNGYNIKCLHIIIQMVIFSQIYLGKAKMASINQNIKKKSTQGDKRHKKAVSLSEKAIKDNYLDISLKAVNHTASLYTKVDNYEDAQKFNRFDNTVKKIKNDIRQMGLANDSLIGSAIIGSAALGYYNIGYQDETSTGLKLGFRQLKNDALEAFKFNTLDRITWIERNKANNVDLLNKVAEEIRTGLVEGESLQKVARRIKDRFVKLQVVNKKTRVSGGYADALTIVRTETHRAYNLGKLKGFDQVDTFLDENAKRILVATLDSRTRPQSAQMDGQVADEQGFFTYPNGVKAKVPGTTGVAKYDIRDRETVIQSFSEEDLPTQRRDGISKELVPNTSFEEWAKLRGITKNKYGQRFKWAA